MSRPHNGIHLSGGPPFAAMPQQPNMVNVAAPLNDVQLVALTAAVCPGPAAEAVERAIEIVAIAVVKVSTGGLAKLIDAAIKAHRPVETSPPNT